MPMQVYLIRHTEVDIPIGLCYGQTEVPLQKNFHKDFKKIRDEIPSTIDLVYSSPLKRCTTLAEFLSNSVQTDPRLLELNFGNWENKVWQEIPKKETADWMNNFVQTPTPNGESMLQLFHRVSHFLDELRQRNEENVVIVTHAGVIRCLICYLLEIPLQNIFKLKVNYGQLYKIHVDIDRDLDSLEI